MCSYCTCCSLNVVETCVRCQNWHPFSWECLSEYCLRRSFPGIGKFFRDIEDRQPVTDTDVVLILAASELRGPLRQKVMELETNACPVCRVDGPFYPDESTDDFVATLEVGPYALRSIRTKI